MSSLNVSFLVFRGVVRLSVVPILTRETTVLNIMGG